MVGGTTVPSKKVNLTKKVQFNSNTDLGNTSFYEVVDETAKQREIRSIQEHQRIYNGRVTFTNLAGMSRRDLIEYCFS